MSMEYLWFPLIVASVLAFIGFRQWLRHQQRAMVHRERLAALEKGADLPAVARRVAGHGSTSAWTASCSCPG